MRYRKKPVIIKAMQLDKTNIKDVYEFINGPVELDSYISKEKWLDYENIVISGGLRLKTLESHNETQVADIGDFIVKGVAGEFYPCKPDIFHKTYEAVEE